MLIWAERGSKVIALEWCNRIDIYVTYYFDGVMWKTEVILDV